MLQSRVLGKDSLCLVVEDQADTREFLRASLQTTFPGVTVFAAATLRETKAWLDERVREKGRQPLRLAVIDLGLPDGSGVEIVRYLARVEPEVLSVVVTIYDDDIYLFEALAAGASGYIVKGDDSNLTVDLLKRIDSGEPPLSPSIAHRLIAHFRQSAKVSSAEVELSPRETETLTLLARGLTVAEAAREMGLSAQTVAGYVKAIYQKLHVSNRVEATREAIRLGLV